MYQDDRTAEMVRREGIERENARLRRELADQSLFGKLRRLSWIQMQMAAALAGLLFFGGGVVYGKLYAPAPECRDAEIARDLEHIARVIMAADLAQAERDRGRVESELALERAERRVFGYREARPSGTLSLGTVGSSVCLGAGHSINDAGAACVDFSDGKDHVDDWVRVYPIDDGAGE